MNKLCPVRVAEARVPPRCQVSWVSQGHLMTQGHLICVHSQAFLGPGTVCDHCLPSVSHPQACHPVPHSTSQPAHSCLILNRMTPVPGIQSPPHQVPISLPATSFTPGTLHSKSRHLINTHHQISPLFATLRNPTHACTSDQMALHGQ